MSEAFSPGIIESKSELLFLESKKQKKKKETVNPTMTYIFLTISGQCSNKIFNVFYEILFSKKLFIYRNTLEENFDAM